MAANLKELVQRYKADRESVYNTWFIDNEPRMKAFRYLLFSDISCNCEAMGRFGDDWRVLLKVARGRGGDFP